jgi:hypothetical protein
VVASIIIYIDFVMALRIEFYLVYNAGLFKAITFKDFKGSVKRLDMARVIQTNHLARTHKDTFEPGQPFKFVTLLGVFIYTSYRLPSSIFFAG